MVDEQSTAETQSKARKRILLVDDDREIIESMRMALEAAGYEILDRPRRESRNCAGRA